jgi:hypothetical protein
MAQIARTAMLMPTCSTGFMAAIHQPSTTEIFGLQGMEIGYDLAKSELLGLVLWWAHHCPSHLAIEEAAHSKGFRGIG